MTPEEIKESRLRRKRLARMRFKSLVRQVAINRVWLSELEETSMGDNVRRNVAIIVRRKGVKGILTLPEKAMLNTPIAQRTVEQRKAIVTIMASLKCFANYHPKIRSRLAKVTYYQYFNQGRTIIREGHFATAMYFILDGEITVTRKTYDKITREWFDEPIMAYGPGDVFGEVALLQNDKRNVTCITAVATELLCIYRDDFDAILKDTLKQQWDYIKLAMKRFEYFNTWTSEQIVECCVMSKINQYDPLQTIYAEDAGRLNFVFFVLSGTCMILQCLKLNYNPYKQHKHYELEPIVDIDVTDSVKLIEKVNREADKKRKTIAVGLEKNVHYGSDDVGNDIGFRPRFGLIPDKKQDIEFVEVGSFSAGSVFGLGEEMEHRTIVAQNYVQCLLIPRFWLFQKSQNVGNVWQRTKMYLNSSVPSRQKIFDDYMSSNKWKEYKDKVINDLNKQMKFKNTTTVQDVPMICRIDNGL